MPQRGNSSEGPSRNLRQQVSIKTPAGWDNYLNTVFAVLHVYPSACVHHRLCVMKTLWLKGRLLWELHILNSPFIFVAGLESPDLWFIPMLSKPRQAPPAQTCMKCKTRKKTQTCRSICREPVSFYFVLFMWKVCGKFEDDSSAILHSWIPAVAITYHHLYAYKAPLINVWRQTQSNIFTQVLSCLRPNQDTRPLFLVVSQLTGCKCGLWHTAHKCSHTHWPQW